MATQLKSGHTAEPLSDEDSARILKDFPGQVDGLVRVQPGGWILPTPYLEMADKIYDFKFRESDVVVMTHPKCGTTWTQDLLWNMVHNPNIDNPAAEEAVNGRSPYLEVDILLMGKMKEMMLSDTSNPMLKQFAELCPGANPADGIGIQMAAATPGIRIIKSHLTFPLLPPDLLDTTKVVYVMRNPKDMCISYNHHCRMARFHDFQGNMDLFVDYLTNDELFYGPYWNHVKEGWKRRDHPRLYVLFFENLKADPVAEVRELDKFLGTDLTEEQMTKVIEHTSFDKMKARDAHFPVTEEMKKKILNQEVVQNEGGFFRKGQVGDFKNKLTPAQESKIDAWTKMNTEGMDIEFKYSI
ncbi:sulfotransferase 1A1-like isoform X2 [Oratosquilla oratoria]